jgi:hypothetical protein
MKRMQLNLAGAEAVYAISNVPLFLLRKLQSDAAPRQISVSLSTDEILDELKDALQSKPRTLREAVEPYVLLVALSQKRDISALNEATRLSALHYDWFSYLANCLVQTFIPSQRILFDVPAQIQAPPTANTSNASTQTRKIIIP